MLAQGERAQRSVTLGTDDNTSSPGRGDRNLHKGTDRRFRRLPGAFHKKDWGGESNDLYTANVIVNGTRRPTAFMLKGNGLKARMMEVKHCGKNGDQVIRLFQSPAELFVIQFVRCISEAVVNHAHGEVARLKTQGKDARFLIMDGQDTARILRAYGKL